MTEIFCFYGNINDITEPIIKICFQDCIPLPHLLFGVNTQIPNFRGREECNFSTNYTNYSQINHKIHNKS